MGQIANFDLPAPPSVNHYWKHWRGRVSISDRGRLYRQAVVAAVKPLGVALSPPIGVVVLYSGSLDLDNLGKCLLDALQHAGVFPDDNDIDDLHFVRVGRTGETVSVEVREI